MVAGVGLLLRFRRMGLLGRYLEAAGVRVVFTSLAVVRDGRCQEKQEMGRSKANW